MSTHDDAQPCLRNGGLSVTDPLKDPADQPVEPDTPEPVPGSPTLSRQPR